MARHVAQRGYTYIAVLLVIAIVTVGLASAAQSWRTLVQRSKEADLAFIGGEFKQALERYYANSPGAKRFPQSLEELVLDPRYPTPVRYLRKLYRDPMTGVAQWGIVTREERIVGVYSLSEKKPLRSEAPPAASGESHKYSDWKFVAAVQG